MPTGFLGLTDAALLAWSVNFNELIQANPLNYGLSSSQASDYGVVHVAYAGAYQTAIDPITRTKGKVAAKNAARTALKDAARLLAKIVEGQASVTDEQKIDLGLNVRKMPTPAPVPTTSPDIDFISVAARVVKIRLHDAASGSRRKPVGVKGATVFSHVGATPPGDISAWKFEGNFNQSVVDLVFPDTVPNGATVWLTAFWFNTRSESGFACNPVSTHLAGGGVSMAA